MGGCFGRKIRAGEENFAFFLLQFEKDLALVLDKAVVGHERWRLAWGLNNPEMY